MIDDSLLQLRMRWKKTEPAKLDMVEILNTIEQDTVDHNDAQGYTVVRHFQYATENGL